MTEMGTMTEKGTMTGLEEDDRTEGRWKSMGPMAEQGDDYTAGGG